MFWESGTTSSSAALLRDAKMDGCHLGQVEQISYQGHCFPKNALCCLPEAQTHLSIELCALPGDRISQLCIEVFSIIHTLKTWQIKPQPNHLKSRQRRHLTFYLGEHFCQKGGTWFLEPSRCERATVLGD